MIFANVLKEYQTTRISDIILTLLTLEFNMLMRNQSHIAHNQPHCYAAT